MPDTNGCVALQLRLSIDVLTFVSSCFSVRCQWKFYMANTDALIWVVDSTDCERIDSDGSEYDFSSSRVELHKGLLEDELRDAVVLVFATKQDVAGAMTPAEVSERLGLPLIKSHQWHVQGCCGTTAEGLYEGLQWMTEAVKRQVKTKPKVVRPAEAAAASSVPLSGPPPQKPVVTRLKPPPVSQRRKLDAISSDNPDVLAVKGDDDPLAPASVSPSVPATVPTAPSLTTA